MPIDHGHRHADHESWLNDACLRDQLLQCYNAGLVASPPPMNYDPGRARHEAFFRKMYGNTKKDVEKNLSDIVWMPGVFNQRLRVSTVNNVHRKLEAVSRELVALPKTFHKYLQRPGGTFNWRPIAGTQRMSMHSFGVTIDINVAESDYWRNAKPDGSGRYRYVNKIPMEIVQIFERHGFIWGGRWYHYDTMHFEYRPELLQTNCSCK
jgi:peptidoglycan L-alanyl-D-glutamate endopeptidase CwlK